MDSIRINDLKIPARHGVYDFEKSKDGIFEIDLELFCNLKGAGYLIVLVIRWTIRK